MIGSVSTVCNIQGLTFSNVTSIDYPTTPLLQVTAPAGATGVLTTRTDANTGTITMDAAHAILTGDRVTVFWLVSGVVTAQYKVTVGTVAGLSVPIDLGVGANLPTAATAVVVTKDIHLDYSFESTSLDLLGVAATAPAQVVLEQAGGTVAFAVTIQTNGKAYVWNTAGGLTAPVTADVAKAWVTNGSATGVNTISVAVGNLAP